MAGCRSGTGLAVVAVAVAMEQRGLSPRKTLVRGGESERLGIGIGGHRWRVVWEVREETKRVLQVAESLRRALPMAVASFVLLRLVSSCSTVRDVR